MQALMTSMGSSPFSPDEASAMGRFAADDKGRVRYENYAYVLANDGQ